VIWKQKTSLPHLSTMSTFHTPCPLLPKAVFDIELAFFPYWSLSPLQVAKWGQIFFSTIFGAKNIFVVGMNFLKKH
jgi:hypothetical protein